MRIATIVAAALFTTSGLAAAERAHAAIQRYDINIPRQPLDDALKDLAQQTGLQIGRFGDTIDGTALVGPIQGSQTPEQALKALLTPQALSYKAVNGTTIAIINPKDRAVSTSSQNSPLHGEGANSPSAHEWRGGQGDEDSSGTGDHKSFWSRLLLAQANQGSAESTGAVISSSLPNQAHATAKEIGEHNAALEEIVVTATRQARLLSSVPISASAFSQKSLDAQGVKQIDDIALLTPGVTFSRGNAGSTQISIRGISSDSGASTTGVYIDDTPVQSRVIGFSNTTVFPSVFDLERVEVLRGPQGTLFGAGSEGGTVRFITPQPSLTTFSTYARGELGFTEHGDSSYEAGLALGGPVVDDKIGVRASAWYRRDGGYTDRVERFGGALIDKNADWQNSYTARIAFGFQPVDHLLITPSFYYQNLYINDSQTYWEYLSNPGKSDFNNGSPVTAPFEATSYLPALNVNYETDYLTVTSNTSYYEQDNQNNRDLSALIPNDVGIPISPTQPVPGFPDYRNQDLFVTSQKAFTEELRVQSNQSDSRLTWVVGAFFQREHQSSNQYVPDTPEAFDRLVEIALGGTAEQIFGRGLADGRFSYRSVINSFDKQIAGFGEASFKVAGGLTLTAGIRAARATFNFTNHSDGPFNGGPTVVTGNESETPVIPKYGISYQVSPGNLLYATAAKGFRTGGANAPIPGSVGCTADLAALGYNSAPDSYKSDSVWSYEVGSKNRFLDGRLRLESSIFDVKWSGIQESVILGNGCGLNFVANLGKATSRGFDVQGELLATDHLTTGLAVGYTHAVFDESVLSPPDAVTGIRPVLVRKGNSLGVNPWTVAMNVQYDFVAWGHNVYMRADDQFASRQTNPTAAEDPNNQTYASGLLPLPQTNLLSFRLGTRFSNNVDLSLYVKNVLDSHPILGRNQIGSNIDLIYVDRTFRPRTVGITLTSRH